MDEINTVQGEKQFVDESRNVLEDLLREGARKMLQQAIEREVAEYLERHDGLRDVEFGHRLVVRNGWGRARKLQTGIGHIEVNPPRVRDRREGYRFTSSILPAYMRRVPSLEALLPVLYLKGISGNGIGEALSGILGKKALGLSPSAIMRLKESWQAEQEEWTKRDLSGKRYVYFWADGIYFNVRLSTDRPCLLVVIGTLEDGRKELVAMRDGVRESTLSWKELLFDLKRRGLRESPRLAVGDGAMGFWAALEEIFPETAHQRCWMHKIGNILDKMPKHVQPSAKRMLQEICLAETRGNAVKAYQDFIRLYKDKYPKAVECLIKDEKELLAFFDFPAAHWAHIKTTNPIESTFATVRHRHRQTKGCGSVRATISMAFKLTMEASKHWRRIRGYELIEKVLNNVKFIDGIEKNDAA
jgi:transposase-like protein